MKYRVPLIALVASLLLGVGFYFLLWNPKNEELEEVRAETAQLETQRGQLQNELRRLEEIAEREVEFRAALARLEEYIPSGPTQAAAIRQFQATADAAGVTIGSIAFSQPVVVVDAPPTGTPDTILASITVTMVVEGGYFQAVDFFRRIEVDVPRAVLMQNAGVGEGPDGYSVLSTNWTGLLYTVIPDPELYGAPEDEPQDAEAESDADAGEDADVDADDGEEIQARGEGEDQS